MNSQERVLAAINCQTPDRLPIDFGGHRSSGISAIAYAKLKKELNIDSGDIYVYDMIQQLAIIEPPVLEVLGVDAIELGRGFLLQAEDWKDWVLPDGTPCKIPFYVEIFKEGEDWFLLDEKGNRSAVQKKGCLYFEQLFYPLAERGIENDDFADLEQILPQNMWNAAPSPGGHLDLEDPEDFKAFADGAASLRASTDKAIIGLFGGNLFETPQFLYNAENYLFYLAGLERYLAAVGDHIDIILFGDDLGSNQGPMIDPEMYRTFYKPFHKIMWSKVKELAPHLKIQLHCCGGIEPFLEDLIEAGLDMINPVQINAHTMEPVLLRKKYGGRFCFWGGGCNTQEILNRKSPDEVEAHVNAQLDIWRPYDDFVFQQVHNILPGVPVENILAMFEAVREFR
jgi:uroporphyrinogen decarboxylase